MANLKVAIALFLVLLGITFGMLSNMLEKFNVPGLDFLRSVKDRITQFFVEKNEKGNVNFTLNTEKKELFLDVNYPSRIEMKAINITIKLGHKIVSKESNVTIYNFTGMLNYTEEIWISGSSSKVILDNVEIDDLKDMKLHAALTNIRIDYLKVSRLELRGVKGFLNLSDMSMDIDYKNVTIRSFSGAIRINEEMTIRGSCNKIYVNDHLIQ